MAIDDKNPNKAPEKRFFYEKCYKCGSKIHIDALQCHVCGTYNFGSERKKLYTSQSEADFMYCRPLNSAGKCMKCHAERRGAGGFCERKWCYARGNAQVVCYKCKVDDFKLATCCAAEQKASQELRESGAFERLLEKLA